MDILNQLESITSEKELDALGFLVELKKDVQESINESIAEYDSELANNLSVGFKNVDEKINNLRSELNNDISSIELQKGDKGDKGETGLNGKDGKDGIDGKDGQDGQDGKDGKDGVDGKDGKDGIDGSTDTPKQIKEKLLKEGLKIEEITGYDSIINQIATKYSPKGGAGVRVLLNNNDLGSSNTELNLIAGTNITLSGSSDGHQSNITINSAGGISESLAIAYSIVL